MYYDTELLRKRRGGLGTFWLAATLGTSNTRFKKLSKKDLLACNVPKACQKLIEPDEPLALRLSSNLMLGVTRVYSQQCVLLHQDTTSTHAALRKAIVQMWDSGSGLLDPTAGGKHAHALAGGAAFGKANKGAVGGIDQDAHKERGRGDAINLRRDRDEDLMLLDAGFGDQDGGGAEGGATTGRAARGGAFGLGAPRRGGAMLFGGIDDLAWQALEDELRGHPAERGRAQGQGSPGLDDEFEIGSVRGAGDDDEEYREGAAASRAKREKKPAARKATATTAREEDITLPAHLNMQEDMFEPQEYAYDQVEMGDANFELGLDLEETHNLKLPPALAARRARSSSAGAGAASGLLPSTDRASGTGRYEGSSSVGLGRHGTLPPSPPREGDHEGEADPFAAAGMAFDVDLGMGVDHTHDHDHGGGGHDFGAGELDAPLGLDADRAGSPIRLREGSAARADGNESERAASVLPTPPPSTDKKKRKAASRSRSKKAHKVLEDDVIMLETKDLQRARDAYSAEMKSMNRAAERAEYEKVHRARALQMMSGVPKGVGAPLLVEFLKDAYSIAHLVKEPEKRERKSRTTVAGPAGRADAGNGDGAVLGKRTRDQDDVIERRRRDREGTAVSSALGRGAAGRAASLGPGGYDPLDYQDGFDGGAGDFGPDAPAGDYDARPLREGSAVPSSVERGRGRSRALSHIGGEGEIGRGRQRSASVSYSQQMPWMKPAPEDYSSVLVPGAEASSSARDLSIRHSIVGGTPERIRSGHSRSSSAFRDLPGVARRSPTPLDRECRQGSMPLLGDDNDYLPAGGDGYDAERGRASTDRDGGSVSRDAQRNELKRSNASGSDRRIRTDSLSSSRYSSSADDSQTRVARSQEQTARFLDYARNVAQAESGRLHLSDIAPVVGSNPTIAAAAFYQVLVLATRGLMKIQSQEEAYGEIHLLCI